MKHLHNALAISGEEASRDMQLPNYFVLKIDCKTSSLSKELPGASKIWSKLCRSSKKWQSPSKGDDKTVLGGSRLKPFHTIQNMSLKAGVQCDP